MILDLIVVYIAEAEYMVGKEDRLLSWSPETNPLVWETKKGVNLDLSSSSKRHMLI